MIFWIFLIIQLLIAAGAGFAAFILIRSVYRNFKEKKTLRAVGLSLAGLIAIIIAIFFILAVIGAAATILR